jgi:hypothetical protein
MRKLTLLLGLAGLLLCAACGGGTPFVPATGPFTGTMSTPVDGPLGQLSFTYTDGLIGGTATLTIDGNLGPLSVSAVVSGKGLAGEARNVNLGGGDFVGVFQDETHSSGTFTFVDTAETVLISGTWIANVPLQ